MNMDLNFEWRKALRNTGILQNRLSSFIWIFSGVQSCIKYAWSLPSLCRWHPLHIFTPSGQRNIFQESTYKASESRRGALPKSFLLQNSHPLLFQSQVWPNGGGRVFVAGLGAPLGQLLTVGRSSEHVWRTLCLFLYSLCMKLTRVSYFTSSN